VNQLQIDYSRRGKRSKRKGDRGELEVRDLLREAGWLDTHRNFMSGGAGGGDIADSIPDWHIECKRTESLQLHAAWRQADDARRPTDSLLIAHRGNNQAWLGTVLVTDVIGLGPYGWSPQVLSPKQSVRAEFFARLRHHGHPLMLHTVAGEAVGTGLLTDLLMLLRMREAEK
jgi:hypothetical protein